MPSLPPADAAQQAALEEALVGGHCGYRPPAESLQRLVAAQRARDARMAATLQAAARDATPVVLIAGAGHVHRQHAVPRYLPDTERALVIAFVEVTPQRETPQAYALAGHDLVWFTPPTPREDPCARPLTGTAAKPPGGTVAPDPGRAAQPAGTSAAP
jgi:uncharacterized iron-regulated protein